MSQRFTFVSWVISLLVGTAIIPVRGEEEASPQKETRPRNKQYALPGASERDEHGQPVKLWLTKPDDAVLREVVKNLPNLQMLGLHDHQSSLAGLMSLLGMKHLERLEFRNLGPDMKPVDLVPLVKIARLRKLSFPDISVAIHCLQRDDDGRVLAIRLYRPDNAILAQAFVEFPRLKSLSIMDGRLTENTFRSVDNLNHLEELVFIHGNRQFTGKSLADVAKLPTLKRLGLNATSIGNHDIMLLARHPQLTKLDFGNTKKIDDVGIERIVRFCPRLTELDVSGLQITNRSARAIARLKHLQDLNIANTRIDDEGLAMIASMAELRTLSLPTTTTDVGLAEVGKLTGLRELSMFYPKVTDAGTAHLVRLQNLESLIFFCHDGVTDESLLHIGRLKQLKYLSMSSNEIKGHGLSHLNKLSRLERLSIDGHQIRGRHLSAIARLKSLRHVNTGHALFDTSEDFEALKLFTSLKSLEAGLSVRQVKDLHEAVPDCQILSP